MKNECDIVKDLIFSYNDGVLSETSKNLVENHLKSCENCSNVLKEIQHREILFLGRRHGRDLLGSDPPIAGSHIPGQPPQAPPCTPYSFFFFFSFFPSFLLHSFFLPHEPPFISQRTTMA